jgi:hypothetical protein
MDERKVPLTDAINTTLAIFRKRASGLGSVLFGRFGIRDPSVECPVRLGSQARHSAALQVGSVRDVPSLRVPTSGSFRIVIFCVIDVSVVFTNSQLPEQFLRRLKFWGWSF